MSNLVSSFEKKTIIGFEESDKKIVEIDINKVKQDVGQVRSFFDEEKLDELADSIKQHGILNPIHVHHVDDYYIIITGERRYRACQKIGMNTIPSIVHHDISEKDIKALQLIENLQREDLSAIETAKGFKSLKETGLKQRQIARSLGVSESTVTKYLAVIDPKKIPIDWLEQIEENYSNASLRDLYEIASANKRKKPQLFNNFMKRAKVDIEVEIYEEKPKKQSQKAFEHDELLKGWEVLIRAKRKDPQNLLRYISPKKMKLLIEMANEE